MYPAGGSDTPGGPGPGSGPGPGPGWSWSKNLAKNLVQNLANKSGNFLNISKIFIVVGIDICWHESHLDRIRSKFNTR